MVGTQEKEASIWHVLFGIQRDNANLYYANMHNAVNTDMGWDLFEHKVVFSIFSIIMDDDKSKTKIQV